VRNWRPDQIIEMTKQQRTDQPAVARLRGGWRWCVALFTALTFVLVVATSGSHVHESARAAHDCALCSAVVDALADIPPAPVVVHDLTLASYHIVTVAPLEVAYASPLLLPPSCGPPHASA
jgi:hypothetical protein